MDTRQLAAFCAVVERRSFSQAAARLGVTQPAISLQVRALEDRLGRQLLDRSGRRVEPTEAGLRLYRNAQRILSAEEQPLAELAADGAAEGRGTLAPGAPTRPRSLEFEPLARDEIVLAVPPGHRFAGGNVALDELREEPLVVMQEGAGVRQVIEEEL